MKLTKEDVRSIRKLMVFAALLVAAVIYIKYIISGAVVVLNMFSPFVLGGLIAFILNIPMGFFERKISGNGSRRIKGQRAISFFCAFLSIIAVIAFVLIIIIPQVADTVSEITRMIPLAVQKAFNALEKVFSEYPQILEGLRKLEGYQFNWSKIITSVTNFLKTGITDVINTTFLATGSIIGGAFDFFISFIFAIYILAQKEKLTAQFARLFKAYLPEKHCKRTFRVLPILYSNFKTFVTCQCVEAVILGCMFVVMMTIFRLPYAMLIGVLISVTALIPVVGAFIGCIVGALLILMVSPMQALIFVALFLVLQQIEGNLIYPRVVGGSIGLPPIWVLMAVSLGGSLLGVVGMLIFIPITSTVYTLLREDVGRREALEKEIE